MSESWTCSVCGAVHEGAPFEWGFAEPAYWDDEREAAGGFLDPDICTVPRGPGETDHFVRGVVEIPIVDGVAAAERSFGIGAWVSLSERNFQWYVDHPDADRADQGGAWFGWLSNDIPVYEDTLGLKTNVFLSGPQWRPAIEIQPSDHPLFHDQNEGITLARARRLSALWLHLRHA
jgi:hypothetical protein